MPNFLSRFRAAIPILAGAAAVSGVTFAMTPTVIAQAATPKLPSPKQKVKVFRLLDDNHKLCTAAEFQSFLQQNGVPWEKPMVVVTVAGCFAQDDGKTHGMQAAVIKQFDFSTVASNEFDANTDGFSASFQSSSIPVMVVDMEGMFSAARGSLYTSLFLTTRAIAMSDILIYNGNGGIDASQMEHICRAGDTLQGFSGGRILRVAPLSVILFAQRLPFKLSNRVLGFFPDEMIPTFMSNPQLIQSSDNASMKTIGADGQEKIVRLDVRGLQQAVRNEVRRAESVAHTPKELYGLLTDMNRVIRSKAELEKYASLQPNELQCPVQCKVCNASCKGNMWMHMLHHNRAECVMDEKKLQALELKPTHRWKCTECLAMGTNLDAAEVQFSWDWQTFFLGRGSKVTCTHHHYRGRSRVLWNFGEPDPNLVKRRLEHTWNTDIDSSKVTK